jgi:hypothetical protein
MSLSPAQKRKYQELRLQGLKINDAARVVGISRTTAYRHEQDDRLKQKYQVEVNGRQLSKDLTDQAGPIAYADLCLEAKRAWGDFGYFQRRYFGRIATPWQVEAAERVVGWLDLPYKVYAVVNAPPGGGKSTLFTHDLPAWLTVRNRAIRGQIGSKVEMSARTYLQRLRRDLERTVPWQNEAMDVERGLALDAEATLAGDFGRFRPDIKDVWSNREFVVAQHGQILIAEKEPTWRADGQDSGFQGMREDIVIWDDVVDSLTMRTVQARETQQKWWDEQAERRLEPHGVLILQGQRMGADDLYRYALDKKDIPEDVEVEELDLEHLPSKYKHVVYKAHYDENCQGEHSTNAPYYPEGCLLDPRRVTWREIQQMKLDKTNNFQVLYQQEDADPANVLVNPLWIKGGQDPQTREIHPGCYDNDRGLRELTHNLHGQILSIATADPSPTKYWSVQWWCVRVVDGVACERYLMDHTRTAMDAPDFLDWNNATQTFSGLMQEWQETSTQLGWPIGTWIVEANAAQRFMLQHEHVRRWTAQWRVQLIPHQTQRNKSDPEYGVQMLGPLYRHGLCRLPNKRGSYFATLPLTNELTHWTADGTGYRTDDTVMAQWFVEWNLPQLLPANKPLPRFKRPSWLRTADTYRRSANV